MHGEVKKFTLLLFLLILVLSGFGILYGLRSTDGSAARISSGYASLWYSPLELDFGALGVDDTSPAQVVQITNIGTLTLNFSGGMPRDDNFTAAHNCDGGLPPGETCQVFFRFSPKAVGDFSTTAGPLSEAGEIDVILRGIGVGADFTYNARSLDFGQTVIGNTAGPQSVMIRNTGMAPLTFTEGELPLPFSATQNCAPSLAPGDTCHYFYTFSPTTSGIFTTTTGPSSNAGKQMLVDLRGQGISSAGQYSGFYVSPLEIEFGPVGVGLTSSTQDVTITNQSDSALLIAGGGLSPPFFGARDCPEVAGVPPGESCQYFFTFNPSEGGVFSATSSSTTNLGDFTIMLYGSGQGASLSVSPPSIDFGPVPLGATSNPQVVTITNTSPIPLIVAGGAVNDPFSGYRNCPGEEGVPPGESCQYTFFFMPTELGRFRATSNSYSNGGSFNIQLAGGVSAPQIDKRFVPSVIAPGGVSTLELLIANPNATVALTEVNFGDTLPPGMRVASPLTYSTSSECGSPVFSPDVGDELLTFSGGTIPGESICLIQVGVTANAMGSYTNTTDMAGSGNAGWGNFATTTLFVGYRQFMPAVFR